MDTAYETYTASLKQEIDASIAMLKRARQTPKQRPLGEDTPAWQTRIDEALERSLQVQTASEELVRPPKNINVGWQPDYALPMFEQSKQLHRSPALIATDAAAALADVPAFARVEAAGPYVNFRLTDETLLERLRAILSEGKTYGTSADNADKVAVVEYSSPNVAKPFGINHLRATVIGESLARLFQATGFTVIRDNHLGDWGTQFGNLLAAYQTYASDRPFDSLTVDELTALYVRFSQEKKESPELARLGQQCFLQLEQGDPVLRERWAIALARSMQEFSSMYTRLGVHFDTQIGEAYYVERSRLLLDELAAKHPASLVFDPKSKVVYISGEHPVVVRTEDGYGVYAARDLATIQFRQQTYDPDLVVYVVGGEQASYFRTLFSVASEAGLTARRGGSTTELEHVGFGLLLDASGKKLSTRKGTSGKLEDVLDALAARAFEETKQRNPEAPDDDVRAIAEKVATGALIWNDLRTDHLSSVRFDMEHMLRLGGGSVIDILYAYSRTCSILEKLEVTDGAKLAGELPAQLSNDIEHELARTLGEFGGVVQKAAAVRGPHLLVGYLQELAQLHGRFYEESRVVGIDDKQLAHLRTALHCAFKTVIENGLTLLNIPIVRHL